MPKLFLALVVALALTGGSALAQDEAPPESEDAPTEVAQVLEADAVTDSTATVVLGRQELFEVGPESIIGPQERAASFNEALLAAAKSRRFNTDDLRLLRDERIKATVIMAGRMFLGAVWDYEAEALGVPTEELANERLETIRQAIIEYREDYSSRSLIKGGIIAVVAVVLFLVGLKVIGVFRHRLEDALDRWAEGRVLFKVVEGEALVGAIRMVDRFIYTVLLFWITLALLNFLLSLFPWTARIASQVFDLALGPLQTSGEAFVDLIPSLFFLIFIGFATVVALRGIRFFFGEIERGRIKFRGFYPDWARPTFNLVRVMIFAFAAVVAIPYIPGSGSSAFKGMSLFIGVLVSLGSGGAVSNIISGIILIYMRPFAIGDRVQIGETVGDVVDRNLLTTRVRTPKNERVTIPNTNILNGQIINYTSKARKKELILHTSVTIGYDVPWRQVHELLLTAAKSVEDVMEDPEPFILQKALSDFYVEYELNAYTDKPRQIPASYSRLHENIQDQFDAAGVEILSPHYRVLREDDSPSD